MSKHHGAAWAGGERLRSDFDVLPGRAGERLRERQARCDRTLK